MLETMQTRFNLLLKGGHVIDPKNNIDRAMDVAIAEGKIARVAENIPDAEAEKVVHVDGLYVTPGLLDIHVHAYAGTGQRNAYCGDNSLYPDGFNFRTGVTTVLDVGSSGWRNFLISKTVSLIERRPACLHSSILWDTVWVAVPSSRI